MIITETSAKWQGKMAFQASLNGHKFFLDAEEKHGGQNKGVRPKPLLLTSLAGCTGMDVVSILNKMRIKNYEFNIEVKGYLTEEHPKYYHKIDLFFNFKGSALPEDKIKKAIELSQTRYCGVTTMLQKAAQIQYFINIEEEV